MFGVSGPGWQERVRTTQPTTARMTPSSYHLRVGPREPSWEKEGDASLQTATGAAIRHRSLPTLSFHDDGHSPASVHSRECWRTAVGP